MRPDPPANPARLHGQRDASLRSDGVTQMPLAPLVRIALRGAVAGLLSAASLCVGAAPNAVQINASLLTSGQPSAAELSGLAAQGIQAVIYLAPSTVPDAIKDEPRILAQHAVEFVHIPIPFDAPGERHFDELAATLDRLKEKKVLVHCQVNMRASTMVFLYRAIRLRDDPATAYEAVSKVWKPEGAWKRLLVTLLKKHEISFDPY